jgi:anti-sigma B factor antagonist
MPAENLQIVSSQGAREGQTMILSLKGPLNIHTIFNFQNAVRAETASAVIIDFSGVPFIDSAGLGALVAAHVSARKADRKLVFAMMNTQVMALIEMTRLKQLFRIYPTIHDAESGLDNVLFKQI